MGDTDYCLWFPGVFLLNKFPHAGVTVFPGEWVHLIAALTDAPIIRDDFLLFTVT